MEFSFYLSQSFLFFLYPLTMCKNLEQIKVLRLQLIMYVMQTAACEHMFMLAVINMLLCVLLHHELYNKADIYLGQIDFRMFLYVFAILLLLQLLSHVNTVVL